jgi:hypothetical protein
MVNRATVGLIAGVINVPLACVPPNPSPQAIKAKDGKPTALHLGNLFHFSFLSTVALSFPASLPFSIK